MITCKITKDMRDLLSQSKIKIALNFFYLFPSYLPREMPMKDSYALI